MLRQTLALALLLTTASCGSTSGVRRSSSDVLTRDDIAASTASNAYDLVRQLRPHFLRTRGAVSVQNPNPVYAVVYLNDFRQGSLEQLRNIPIEVIEEIRYINAADATTRWGTGHGGGAIMVRAVYR